MNVLWKFLFITLLLYATVNLSYSKKLCDRKVNFCKNSKCNCPEGLKPNKNKTCCVPICEHKCIGGKCVGLNKCKCLPGHIATEIPNVCEPFCSNCTNGYCYGYEKCANRRWNSKNSVEPKTQCGMDVFTTTTNILDDNTELPKSNDILKEGEQFGSPKLVESNSATELLSIFPEKIIKKNIGDSSKIPSSTSPTEVKSTSSSSENDFEQTQKPTEITSKFTSKTTNPSSRLHNLVDDMKAFFDELDADFLRSKEFMSKNYAVSSSSETELKQTSKSTEITSKFTTKMPNFSSRLQNLEEFEITDEYLADLFAEFETNLPRILEEETISKNSAVIGKILEPSTTITVHSATEQPLSRIFNKLQETEVDEIMSTISDESETISPMHEESISNSPTVIDGRIFDKQLKDGEVTSMTESEKSFSYEVKMPGIDDIITPTFSENEVNLILLEETNSNSPAVVGVVLEELAPNIQLLKEESTISPQLEEKTSNSPSSFFGKVGNKLKMTEEVEGSKLLVEPSNHKSSAEEFRLAAVPLGVGILIGIVVLGLLFRNHYRNQGSYNVLQN
ncbi:uncharacterized protein LOC129912974 [Episyrphus balteatus]|uniref:uncharacterized protein LOC129912974 n=1 Tax=Episyrphus balteatus TaxID=286459 RepID=UPI002485663A|nr:uncharacterized protein LOC129912974 [Episyrphus balteatus]